MFLPCILRPLTTAMDRWSAPAAVVATGAVIALEAACAGSVVAREEARPAARMTITPARVLVDQPFTVRLTGLPAGEAVTISCQYADALNIIRRSRATFRADAQGRIDLASQAPMSGTYTGVDPMGLIWSSPSVASPTDVIGVSLVGYTHPDPVTFTAKYGGRPIGRASAHRYLLSGAVLHRSVRSGGLYGEFYWPATKTRGPAVLVFGGSEGGLNPYIMREAALLAARGYAAPGAGSSWARCKTRRARLDLARQANTLGTRQGQAGPGGHPGATNQRPDAANRRQG